MSLGDFQSRHLVGEYESVVAIEVSQALAESRQCGIFAESANFVASQYHYHLVVGSIAAFLFFLFRLFQESVALLLIFFPKRVFQSQFER